MGFVVSISVLFLLNILFIFTLNSFQQGAVSHLCQMVNKQLYQLIEYARRMPQFAQLQREDQILLLRAGWNELMIATVAWRSIEVSTIALLSLDTYPQCN